MTLILNLAWSALFLLVPNSIGLVCLGKMGCNLQRPLCNRTPLEAKLLKKSFYSDFVFLTRSIHCSCDGLNRFRSKLGRWSYRLALKICISLKASSEIKKMFDDFNPGDLRVLVPSHLPVVLSEAGGGYVSTLAGGGYVSTLAFQFESQAHKPAKEVPSTKLRCYYSLFLSYNSNLSVKYLQGLDYKMFKLLCCFHSQACKQSAISIQNLSKCSPDFQLFNWSYNMSALIFRFLLDKGKEKLLFSETVLSKGSYASQRDSTNLSPAKETTNPPSGDTTPKLRVLNSIISISYLLNWYCLLYASMYCTTNISIYCNQASLSCLMRAYYLLYLINNNSVKNEVPKKWHLYFVYTVSTITTYLAKTNPLIPNYQTCQRNDDMGNMSLTLLSDFINFAVTNESTLQTPVRDFYNWTRSHPTKWRSLCYNSSCIVSNQETNIIKSGLWSLLKYLNHNWTNSYNNIMWSYCYNLWSFNKQLVAKHPINKNLTNHCYNSYYTLNISNLWSREIYWSNCLYSWIINVVLPSKIAYFLNINKHLNYPIIIKFSVWLSGFKARQLTNYNSRWIFFPNYNLNYPLRILILTLIECNFCGFWSTPETNHQHTNACFFKTLCLLSGLILQEYTFQGKAPVGFQTPKKENSKCIKTTKSYTPWWRRRTETLLGKTWGNGCLVLEFSSNKHTTPKPDLKNDQHG